MSAVAVLPVIQARAEFVPILKRIQAERDAAAAATEAAEQQAQPAPRPQIAFYRKYTEAMLRRYTRMSMEVGRVPSMLGRGEIFRAKVSNYRMESFEDVVIFCHDVERCLERLDWTKQELIRRVAIEEYTVQETAALMGLDSETVVRRYARALDGLTRILLQVKLLKIAVQ
jgi:predicted DNA-binding protein (UPF0251 family)